MQETIVNWQGFETWTPTWDVIALFAVAGAVAITAILIRLLSTEKDE